MDFHRYLIFNKNSFNIQGRGLGRVGSDILSAIAGRVGSTFRAGSGPRKVTRGQLCYRAGKLFVDVVLYSNNYCIV